MQVRVPFNSICLGLDALATSEGLSEDDKESLSMMRVASESMTTIMNAVLTLSAIEVSLLRLYSVYCLDAAPLYRLEVLNYFPALHLPKSSFPHLCIRYVSCLISSVAAKL
jgi:hypothetical protein